MLDVFFVIQIILAVALAGSVLLQSSNADGLSGLSGSSATGVVSGRAQASFMVRFTTIIAILFMVNSLFLGNIVARENNRKSILIEKELPKAKEQKPVEIPTAD